MGGACDVVLGATVGALGSAPPGPWLDVKRTSAHSEWSAGAPKVVGC